MPDSGSAKLAYILSRLSTFIVGLALDPPTPILLYPREDDLLGGGVPDPNGYPQKIYWGYPDEDPATTTNPDYPSGTLFVWSQAAEIAHGGGWVNELLSVVPGTGLLPLPLHTAGVPMQWIQTNIHAKLGTDEQLIHALRWSPDGGVPIADTGEAALTTFSNTVRDAWKTNYLTTAVLLLLSIETTYDEIRTGAYEQTVPNVSGESSAGHMHQLGSTVLSTITAPNVGTGTGAPLPYEVAMCVTLRTAFPQSGGVSHGRRNRGRTYLGGLHTSCLASQGRFSGTACTTLRNAYGAFISAVNGSTDYHLAVHSMADVQSRTVNKIEIGTVPDVIRKRRNAQKELYPAGTAIT